MLLQLVVPDYVLFTNRRKRGKGETAGYFCVNSTSTTYRGSTVPVGQVYHAYGVQQDDRELAGDNMTGAA